MLLGGDTREEIKMKLSCIFALLIAAVCLTAIPVSPQWSRTSGLELKVDTAEAITYRRARVTSRRVARRDYRYTRRAVRRGAYVGAATGAYRRGCTCY